MYIPIFSLDCLFYSCSWEGGPCPLDAFSPEFTDYGYCVTFNGNPTQPLKTNKTGKCIIVSL